MHKNILKNSVIFVLGDAVSKAIPFLLLPIVTKYLSPEEYGHVSVFVVLISIFGVFASLNMHGAINVDFFKSENGHLKKLIGNAVFVSICSSLLFIVIGYVAYDAVPLKIEFGIQWLVLVGALGACQTIININLVLWAAEQKPLIYCIYQFSQSLVSATLILTLVVGLGMGWQGYIVALLIAGVIFSLVGLFAIFYRGYIDFSVGFSEIGQLLRFGVPLMPHALFAVFRSGADRFVLIALVGAFATGVYGAAYQISLIMGMLVMAINKAWTPYLYTKLSSKPSQDEKVRIVKITYVYFLTSLLMALFFSWFGVELTKLVLDESYANAVSYIPYLVFSFAFQGMYFMVVGYLMFKKKTFIISLITLVSVGFQFVFLFANVRADGAVSAARALMFSFIITFLLTWWWSNRVHPMPWSLRGSDG